MVQPKTLLESVRIISSATAQGISSHTSWSLPGVLFLPCRQANCFNLSDSPCCCAIFGFHNIHVQPFHLFLGFAGFDHPCFPAF
jgi:hypothetical protein